MTIKLAAVIEPNAARYKSVADALKKAGQLDGHGGRLPGASLRKD